MTIAILAGLVATGAGAVDIFVNKDGIGEPDGSSQRPFRSLQNGIDIAKPGDTVLVSQGTYDPIRTIRDGNPEARISVVATHRREVVVQANGRALDVSHPWHTFRGIIFDSAYGPSQVVRANGADGLELLDVEVRRGTSNCIALGDVRQVLIEDSTIHHCINHFDPVKNADSHGITGRSVFDLLIRNTEIYLVTGDAVQLSPARRAWDRIRIEESKLWSGVLDESANGWPAGQPIGENAIDTKVGQIEMNGHGGLPRLTVVDTVAFGWRNVISNQAAYNIKESVEAVFDRVTVYDSELAFRLRFPAHVRIQNAVVYDVRHAFRLEGGLRNSQIFNITLGGGFSGTHFRVAGGTPINLTINNLLVLAEDLPSIAKLDRSNIAVADRAFVGASRQDYRLARSSPAVDAGETRSEVSTDREGRPRPQGERHDVGAYEWSGQQD